MNKKISELDPIASPSDEASIPIVDGGTKRITASNLRAYVSASLVAKGELVFNVKDYSAVGDGVTDDTAAIQATIDACSAAGGGTVYVPQGTYMVKAHVPGYVGNYLPDLGGVEMKSNIHLEMENGATLQAITNNMPQYAIVRVYDKTNVKISGGRIIGDRDTHTGATGEWGYGIAITGGSNITLEDTYITDCWGDGINLQIVGTDATDVPKDVVMRNITSDGNRRQGMSIEGADNVLVTNCQFINTAGTAPGAGVDIEPWQTNVTNRNIRFESCIFSGNAGLGMNAQGGLLNQLTINNCRFENNLYSNSQLQIYCTADGHGFRIMNNKFRSVANTNGVDVSLQGGYDYAVEGNDFVNAVHITQGMGANRIKNVTIRNNYFKPPTDDIPVVWLRSAYADDVVFDGNILDGSLLAPNGSNSFAFSITETSKRVKIINNRIINIFRGVGTSTSIEDIEILHNDFDNVGSLPISISSGSNFLIAGNTFAGSCHINNGSATISQSGGTGVRILNNLFIQAPRIATTNGLGTFQSPYVYVRGNGIGGDSVSRNNVLVKDPASAGYDLFLTSAAAPTTGYLANNDNGIMAGSTSQRPTTPTKGTQFFDTTLNQLQVYDGSAWREINTYVAAPASSTSTGTTGQKAYDTDYLYICTATNTWKRTPIDTW